VSFIACFILLVIAALTNKMAFIYDTLIPRRSCSAALLTVTIQHPTASLPCIYGASVAGVDKGLIKQEQ